MGNIHTIETLIIEGDQIKSIIMQHVRLTNMVPNSKGWWDFSYQLHGPTTRFAFPTYGPYKLPPKETTGGPPMS